MSKNKNKGFKQEKSSTDLFDSATVELKRFRRFAKQVNRLSTTQKVVGGLALLAAGYAFFSTTALGGGAGKAPASDEPDTPDALAPPAAHAGSSAPPSAPKPKRSKPTGSTKHSTFSQEHP